MAKIDDQVPVLAEDEDAASDIVWGNYTVAELVQRIARHTAPYRARIAELEGALRWYGEQARLCRIIHSEGDTGRQALDADGGKRARAALTPEAKGDAA